MWMLLPVMMLGQGWPSGYSGVMLQGFYWESYDDSKWTNMESQADELAEFFKLVWVPQSGRCGGYNSMGYDVQYLFNFNSSFGNRTELISMINTFNSKGIGTIADVVINHRKSLSGWVTFPNETYKGVSYKLLSTDVCRNDDGGATLEWANQNGQSLSANNDTGEDWSGLRDLDHNSSNVQTIVKAYIKMLLEDIGYAGFRYDMTKGYAPSFTGMYNAYANPTYSVGEYWDGNLSAVKGWIDGTKVNGVVQSAAFDFPFRYTIRDAVNNNRWTSLSGSNGLNLDNNYKRYSVTFVENHDTQYRDANDQQDPIRQNVEAANAYMLAMPGTPCVFLKHWQDYKESIKQMIYARQLAGITNTSATAQQAYNSSSNYYAQRTTGTRGILLVAMGSTSYSIPTSYVTVVSGTNYRLALSKTTETAWASVPSGTHEDPFNVNLIAVSENSNAQIIYTLDGSEPTATNGIVASSGSNVLISKSLTLKAGLLKNGAVSGVITRNYTVVNESADTYEITVYLKDPTVAPNNWPQVTYYCWDSDNQQVCGNWPGVVVTDTKMVNGVKFYYKTFTIIGSQYTLNFVFSQGGSTASSHQTVDVTGVRETSFFEVTTQTNKYQVRDVTDDYLPYLNITPGDVNVDGRVTIKDVTDLINYLLSGDASAIDLGAADVNNSGTITIADVTALINMLLSGN